MHYGEIFILFKEEKQLISLKAFTEIATNFSSNLQRGKNSQMRKILNANIHFNVFDTDRCAQNANL